MQQAVFGGENYRVTVSERDEEFMGIALDLAERARDSAEVPVGAVVVQENKIIGEGWNQVVSTSDPSAHAEVVALRDAAMRCANYRLPSCSLYVSIEPCTMCLGAIIHARIAKVFYGAKEPRAGMLDSNLQLSGASFYNHKIQWQGGVLEERCAHIIRSFFRNRRL